MGIWNILFGRRQHRPADRPARGPAVHEDRPFADRKLLAKDAEIFLLQRTRERALQYFADCVRLATNSPPPRSIEIQLVAFWSPSDLLAPFKFQSGGILPGYRVYIPFAVVAPHPGDDLSGEPYAQWLMQTLRPRNDFIMDTFRQLGAKTHIPYKHLRGELIKEVVAWHRIQGQARHGSPDSKSTPASPGGAATTQVRTAGSQNPLFKWVEADMARRDFISSFRAVDLSTDEERRIEEEAISGKSLGAEAEKLILGLINIGANSDFLNHSKERGPEYDANGRHIQAREIGEQLNELGGMNLMQAAYYRLRNALGGDPASSLERAWNGIGAWS